MPYQQLEPEEETYVKDLLEQHMELVQSESLVLRALNSRSHRRLYVKDLQEVHMDLT